MFTLFHYDFMVRAFIAGGIIGILAPVVGIFLVVKRYSLMADTLAHISLAGLAISALLKTPPVITAAATTLLASLGIERLRATRKLFGESILALFLTGGLAVAVVILSAAKGLSGNLLSYLFGSITTVSRLDIWIISTLGIVVIGTTLFLYRQFFAIAFDEDVARAQGMPVAKLNMLLIMMAAVSVSLALRIVGVLLIGALMVIPVLASMQFGFGFKKTTVLAVILSLISVVAGLWISFYLNFASGGTIVLIALLIFLGSLFVHPGTPRMVGKTYFHVH